MDAGLESRMRECIARSELSALARGFAALLDRRDFTAEGFAAVFTAGAVMTYPNGASAEGLDGIAELNAKMNGLFESTLSDVTNELVSFDGEDGALVSFHFTVTHKLIAPVAAQAPADLFVAHDVIDARAVYEGGAWRFSQLEMRGVYDHLEQSVEGPPIPKH